MTTSIADLKAKRQNILKTIKDKAEASKAGSYDDPRFWKPTFDKEKGGGAIIRFLPSPDGSDVMPYEKVITHFFKGPTGQWYAENSRRTLDESDPLAHLNYRLYNTNIESNQNQAKNQKQRPRWYTNILVVKDPANPEAEGKTFLYEFGPAIWKLIEEQLFPSDPLKPNKEPVNVFDVFEGPNLEIRLTPHQLGKSIVPNYDKTEFSTVLEPVSASDDEIIDAVNAGHSLKEFTAESNFKSYAELSKRLVEVLGPTTGTGLETVEGFTTTPVQPAKAQQQLDANKLESQLEAAMGSTPASTVEDETDTLAQVRALIDDE